MIAVGRRAPAARVRRLERAGAAVWRLPARGGRVDLAALVERLAEEGANTVLVEAGGTLAAGALEAGVVDRVYFFAAPLLIGGAAAPTPVEGKGVRMLAEAWRLGPLKVRRVGGDLLLTGDVVG